MVKKPKGGAVSSIEVARLAGVSRSAVSRTFTPGAYVSAEMREKVLAAARMLNYQPNAIARSLSKRSTGLVGLVVAELHHPFLAQLVEQVGKNLQESGFGILLLLADSHNLDQQIPRILSYQVDGVIISASTLDSRLAISLQQAGRPVVLVNEAINPNVLSSVTGDNHAGGRLVADFLYKSGCRRIAHISGRPDTSSGRDRSNGLKEGLLRHGLSVYAEEVGDFRHEEGVEAARRLLSLSPPPDAIFCASDLMALGALEVAKLERNIRIPDELSIVGYDNIELSSWPLQRITTVEPNMPEMARLAVGLIAEKIASDDLDVQQQVIAPTIVPRATTRPVEAFRDGRKPA